MSSDELDNPGQRPYRSRKQKPCNACRKRKICCIRTGENPCQLCKIRNVQCVVEKDTLLPDPPTSSPRPSGATAQLARWSASQHTESELSNTSPRRTAKSVVGLSGDLDPFILRHRQWPDQAVTISDTWQLERLGKCPMSPAYFTSYPSLYRLTVASPRTLEQLLDNKQDVLLKAYFQHVHSTYPLLASREQELAECSHDALTLSLCLIARPFCPSSNNLDGDAIATHVYTSLVDEASHASLDTVEAFLILSQRHGYVGRFPGTPGNGLEIGMLVTAAQSLGLHMNSQSWDISLMEKKRRKRIWWAIYIHDKWSALALGRPPIIDDAQMDVDPLLTTDFVGDDVGGEATVPLQFRIFISMVSLSRILCDLLKSFYSIQAKQKWLNRAPQHLYAEYERLAQLLQQWSDKHLIPISRPQVYPDPLGAVQLAYYTLQMVLYRAVLLKLERMGEDFSRILQKASDASSNAIALVKNLTLSQMSAFWWPFSHSSFFTIGSFILSRVLSSNDPVCSERWAAQFSEYYEHLRAYAPTWHVVRYAESSLAALVSK